MGSSIHIGLMTADFNPMRDIKDIPEIAYLQIGTGYTRDQIADRQKENYHQLNHYTLRENFDKNKWCNGVFLTEKAHKVLQGVVEIVDQYNYDESDPMTDYFNVNFYLHLNIGKWDKDYTFEN